MDTSYLFSLGTVSPPYIVPLSLPPSLPPLSYSCSSNIGRIGLQQFINIGSDCEVAGKVMHEIYHALGRWHEHCRPDRDLYVKINEKNIIPGKGLKCLFSF